MTEKRFQKRYIEKNNKVYDTWKEMPITDELNSDNLLNLLSHLNGLGEMIDTKIEQGRYCVKKYKGLEENIELVTKCNELQKENEQLKQENERLCNFNLHMLLDEKNKEIEQLNDENEQLKKEKEDWKSKCLNASSENSILWNEINILREQGAKPSKAFEKYLDSISSEYDKFWEKKLNKARDDEVL